MSNNEELAKWIIVPFIIFLTPFIMSFVGGALSSGNDVLYPTGGLLQFLQWFSSVVGIYYAETLGLLTLNIYWWAVYPRGRVFTRPLAGISFGFLLASGILIGIHAQFQHLLGSARVPIVFFEQAYRGVLGPAIAAGASLHLELTTDARVHGILGVFFGIMCILAFRMALQIRPSEKLVEYARSFVSVTSLMTVAVTVMTFALKEGELFGSIRHVFTINAILVGTIALAFGLLVGGAEGEVDPLAVLLGVVVAFVIGFTMGDLIIPFTRLPFMLNGQQVAYEGHPLYAVYAGTYTFMSSVIISLSMLARLVSEKDCPLGRILMRLLFSSARSKTSSDGLTNVENPLLQEQRQTSQAELP